MEEKVINGNCWIVHFDILGFSSMVQNFPVWFVVQEYKKALKESAKYNAICRFKFFSDSFIFYTDDDSLVSFQGIDAVSAMFFRCMFLGEIPMRGCINVGHFYADEDNGIFFGPSHIEAYHLAEGQDWIGLVLSEKAKQKVIDYESEGFKLNNHHYRYEEYEVPYNKGPQVRKMSAYNMKLLHSNLKLHNRLWMALNIMKNKAILLLSNEMRNENVDIEKSPEYRKIITKYENTEKFLLYVYPELKEKTENKV